MHYFMFGYNPTGPYEYDLLADDTPTGFTIVNHADLIQRGDLAAIYSYQDQAFVAVAKITKVDDIELYVDWRLKKLRRQDWIKREDLEAHIDWKNRKPFSKTKKGFLNPQFANPVLLKTERWRAIQWQLPKAVQQWLGLSVLSD